MVEFSEFRKAIESGRSSQALCQDALSVLEERTGSWDELLWASKYLHHMHNAEGSFDVRLMEALDRAVNSGLTYDESPELFLETTKILAQLYFKYNKMHHASNCLLLLRELEDSSKVPGWVLNYSAKLCFKLDVLSVLHYPEMFFDLITKPASDGFKKDDPQKIAVVQEFLNHITEFVTKNPDHAHSLPNFIEVTERFIEPFKKHVSNEWLNVLTRFLLSDTFVTDEKVGQIGKKAPDLLEAQNKVLKSLVGTQEEKLEEFRNQNFVLEEKIAELARENAKIQSDVKKLNVAIESKEEEKREIVETFRHLSLDGVVAEPARFKLLVLGASRIPMKTIYGIAKSLGLEKDQLELRLDYDKNKRFDIDNLRYNSPYAGILVGPIAHKVVGVGEYSSVIQKLQGEEGFPHAEEVRTSSGDLKISKTAFRKALERLVTVVRANSPDA